MPRPASSLYHDPEDNVLVCRGCFDREEIPRWVNDGYSYVDFKERCEDAHRGRGCVEAMNALEAASARGRAAVRMQFPRVV